MYEQFMKSKIANRWGTSFKHVVNEEIPAQKVSETAQNKPTAEHQPLSLKTTKSIKNTQTSSY